MTEIFSGRFKYKDATYEIQLSCIKQTSAAKLGR